MTSTEYFQWKQIDEDTWRAKVIGGWLVKEAHWYTDNEIPIISLVYVPDEFHSWELEEYYD